MSKTPHKVILTTILAFCLLIAQAAFLGSSSTANASSAKAVGQAIFLSQNTSPQGTQTTLSVTGTGFAAGEKITVTFNAPNPQGIGVHSPDPRDPRNNNLIVTPPFGAAAATVNGDTDPHFNPGVLPAPPAQPNNSLQYTVTADGSGNFTSPAGIQFVIPANAVAGSYLVEADGAGGRSAGASGPGVAAVAQGSFQTSDFATAIYTITPPVTPQLSVFSSLSTSNVVQLGGIFTAVAIPQTFQAPNPAIAGSGDEVQFLLQDFGAPQLPALLKTGEPTIAGNKVTYNSIPGKPGFPVGFTNGNYVPLTIVACSNGAVLVTSAGTTTPNGTTKFSPHACRADANGGVSATLRLSEDPADPAKTAIVSSMFADQQYAIVAVNNPGGPLFPSPLKSVSTGIKIDSSQTILSLATNVVPSGGSVAVRGFGFAANAPINLYFGGQTSSAATCTFFYNNGAATAKAPAAFAYNSASITGPAAAPVLGTSCLVGTATTDSSGSFNTSVTLPGFATSGATGSILAEDFGAAGTNEAGLRLNKGALASLTVGPAAVAGGLTVSPTTAAVGQTVTFAGNGYTPFEAVQVSLTSTTGAACVGSVQLTTQANGIGAVAGTFIVPTIPGCTVIKNAAFPTGNAGAVLTVNAKGLQSGVVNAAVLTIPTTTASAAYAGPQSVILSGSGFASGEPVTFQFGVADPFTGFPNNALSVSATADASGKVSITQQLAGLLGSGLYAVTARGLNSQFAARATTILTNNGLLQGGLTPCLISPVLAGGSFVLTGTQFAQQPAGNLFNNNVGNGTVSVNFAPVALATTPITVDATGAFTSVVTVPLGTTPGTYTINVTAFVPGVPFAVQRVCSVTVVAGGLTLLINPNSGPIGSTTAISATGFAPGEPVFASLQFPTGSALAGQDVPGTQQVFTASATGTISETFSIKSSVGLLIPGVFNLTVRGGNTGLTKSALFTVTGGVTTTSANIYFAEGFTGTTAGGSNANFTESLSILNANNFTTTYTVTYFIENPGAVSNTIAVTGTIGANSVVERSVNTDVGINKEVAAKVSSPSPLAATRIIARTTAANAPLDSSSSLGQQLDLTAAAPTGGFNYYLASGEVQLTNEEYLTLLNPTGTAATVTINVLPQTVVSATTVTAVAPISASVPANSRVTVPIRKDLIGKGIEKFGLAVNSNVQLAVERVSYYGDGIGSGKYGATTKPAATSAANQFIFAADSGTFPSTGGNASIGTGADQSEIDIVNPGAANAGSATVTVSFFDKNGTPINSQQVQVDGGTRETILVNDVVSTQSDVFSAVVTSDRNIFVERPTFYGGDPSKGGTFAVNSPAGASAGLESVAFPYLDTASATGAPISQTVYLYNPGANTITVRGIYTSATLTVTKTYTVAKNSIVAVNVNADAGTLPKVGLGGIFQIVQTGTGSSDSFVAAVVSNSPDFRNVVGNQGTYPIAASPGV